MASGQGEGSVKGLPQNKTEGATIRRFLELLEAADILPAVDLAAVKQQLPEAKREQDAAEIARKLVAQNALTKHQAASLYQQRPRNLGLGSYIFLDRLGTGGSGSVFKAKHRQTGAISAVKVLNLSGSRSPDALKRFQREAETAARLNHPNIVRALESGEAGGQYFTAMEYVEGTDLSTYVKKTGPLPWEQAAKCVVTAARALSYAHEQGIIHRDIKPANLMLCHDGTIKVLDMGLARLQDPAAAGDDQAAEGLTQTGQVMGTVDYMAPEQALHTRLADARADIYGLGCTLYRLVTGDIPYDGDSMVAKILAHREMPIPSMRGKNPKVPISADIVLQKMLAKKPEDRYQTMKELADELERCLQGYDIAPLKPAVVLPQAIAVLHDADSRSNHSLTLGISHSAIGMPSGPIKGELPPLRRKASPLIPIAAGMVALAALGGIGWILNSGMLTAGKEPETERALRPAEPTATSDAATLNAATSTPLATATGTSPTGTASTGSPPIGLASGTASRTVAPATAAAAVPIDDRGVAHYAINKGFNVVVYDYASQQSREAKTPSELPSGEIAVLALLTSSPNISVDEILARIAAARSLSGLSFKGAVIPPNSLRPLPQYARMQTLIFNDSTLDDAQLKSIETLTTLRQLELARTKTTTASLDSIARLTGLLHLNLAGMKLSVDALKKLSGLTGLQTLNVENAMLADDAVPTLASFKNLQSLTIRGTQISEAGRQLLAQSLPNCRLDPTPGSTTLALTLPENRNSQPTVTPSSDVAPQFAPGYAGEREFAQWCFDQGYRVSVFIPTSPTFSQSINSFATMPPGEFAVIAVHCQGSRPLTRAVFEKLATAPFLYGLYIFSSQIEIEPGAWQHLALLTKLSIFMTNRMTDADAGVLRSLTELQFLNLANSPCGDVALEAVSTLPKLAYLSVSNVPGITEMGLSKLAQAPLLRRLSLQKTPIGDAAVATLSTLQNVESINLADTQITPEGKQKLASALPRCNVNLTGWYGPPVIRPTADAIAAANRAATPSAVANGTAIAAGLGGMVNAVPQPIPGASPTGTAASAVSFDAKKLPIPTEQILAPSLKLIREELFKEKFAAAKKPEERVTLATDLLGQARTLGDDTNGMFAMLREARDLAVDGGDMTLAFSACGNAEQRFELDALEWLAEACDAAVKKTQVRTVSRSMAEGLAFKVEDAVATQKYEVAERLMTTALAAGRKSQDTVLIKQLVEREKQLNVQKKQFDDVAAARKMLAENADDPAANLALGKHLCFTEAKWDEGLPLLAKGSDAALKNLAEKSTGTTHADWIAAGDLWWSQGEKAPKIAQKDFLLAALYFYEKAIPELTGLQKTRIDKRVTDARTALGDAAPKAGGNPFAAIGTQPLPSNLAPPPQTGGPDAAKAFAQWVFARNGQVHARYPTNSTIQPYGTRTLSSENEFASLSQQYTIAGATFDQSRGAVISDADARYLSSLTWLNELQLINQPISNATVQAIGNIPGIDVLNLTGCSRVTDLGIIALAKHVNMRRLTLNGTGLSDQGMKALANMRMMQILYLQGTRITDAGIANLQNMPELEAIYFDQTGVTDQGFAFLRNCRKMDRISFTGTKVTGIGLSVFSGYGNFDGFYAADSQLNDTAAEALSRTSSLNYFHAQNTRVTDATINRLAASNLSALYTIDVTGCRITDASVPAFVSMTRLTTLRVGRTQLSAAAIQNMQSRMPSCRIYTN